jgi:hypothetical protein
MSPFEIPDIIKQLSGNFRQESFKKINLHFVTRGDPKGVSVFRKEK